MDNSKNSSSSNTKDLKTQIYECIVNSKAFLANYKPIFNQFPKQSKDYIIKFVDIIYQAMIDKTSDCNKCFFSLFMLVKLSETKNQELITQIALKKDLLNLLENQSQYDKDKSNEERGVTFFNKQNPSKNESMMGKNYIRLIIETIVYWNTQFGTDDKKKPENIFRQMFAKMQAAKVKFTDKFVVIGKSVEDIINPGKPVQQQQQPQQQAQGSGNQPNAMNNNQIQKGKNAGGSISKEQAFINEVKSNFEFLKNIKSEVRLIMESGELDQEMIDYMTSYILVDADGKEKALKSYADQIFEVTHPEAEKLSEQIFMEIENYEEVVKSLNQYKGKKQGFDSVKKNIYQWIGGYNQTPGQPSIQDNKADYNDIIKAQYNDKQENQENLMKESIPKVMPDIDKSEMKSSSKNEISNSAKLPSNDQDQAHINMRNSVEKPVESSPFEIQKIDKNDKKEIPKQVDVNNNNNTDIIPKDGSISKSEIIKLKDDVEEMKKEENKLNNLIKSDKIDLNKSNKIGPDMEIKPILNASSNKGDEELKKNEIIQIVDPNIDSPEKQIKITEKLSEDAKKNKSANLMQSVPEMSNERSTFRGSASTRSLDKDVAQIQTSLLKKNRNKLSTMDVRSIKENIAKTFKNIHKTPPDFKEETELEIREKLEISLDKMRRERDYYKAELEALNIKANKAEETANMLREKSEENARLLALSEAINDKNPNLEEYQKLIRTFTEEKEQLLRKQDDQAKEIEKLKNLLSDNDKKFSVYQKEINKLEQANELLKLELARNPDIESKLDFDENHPKYKNLLQKNFEQKEKIEILEGEIVQLKELASAATSSLATMTNTLKNNPDIQKDTLDLRSKLQELQQQNLSLTTTLNDFKAKNNTLTNKIAELEEMQNSTINQTKFDETQQRSIRSGLQKTEMVNNNNNMKDDPFLNEEPSPFRKYLFEQANEKNNNDLLNHQPDEYMLMNLGIMNPNKKSNNIISANPNTNGTNVNQKSNKQYVNNYLNGNNNTNKDALSYEDLQDGLQLTISNTNNINANNMNNNNKRLEEDFSISNLISAHKSTSMNINKTIKGLLVDQESSVMYDILKGINFNEGLNKLLYFKLSCLKNKSSIYENNYIQVGISTTIIKDDLNQRNHLKLILYYGNKSTINAINSLTSEVYHNNTTNESFHILCKPEKLDTTILPSKQSKQQLIINFTKFPFTCIQMNCSINSNKNNDNQDEHVNFKIYLPTTINKFMEFKIIDVYEFRNKWKNQNHNILKTSEINLDHNIVKNIYDFKNYFNHLIDLNTQNEFDFIVGKKSIKLAGCFELDIPNLEYLIKIVMLPNQNIVFQLACPYQCTELGAFILQTLGYLFRA